MPEANWPECLRPIFHRATWCIFSRYLVHTVHAILKVIMFIKSCNHVKELRLSGILKRHLRLKSEKESNICNSEMVKHKQV